MYSIGYTIHMNDIDIVFFTYERGYHVVFCEDRYGMFFFCVYLKKYKTDNGGLKKGQGIA